MDSTVVAALVGAAGAVASALIAKRWRARRSAKVEVPVDKITATFDRFDRGIARYLNAAFRLVSAFERTGTRAFKSNLAHAEIDASGIELSRAYHVLNEEAPTYLRDLHTLLPKHQGLIDYADELLGDVLRNVHADGVLSLNPVINAVNDMEKNPLSDAELEHHLDEIERVNAIIRKETQLVEDRQKHLRRKFHEALSAIAGGH